MKKIVQENPWRAQKVRSHQYQVCQKAQVPVLPWKSKPIKEKMRLADLMAEASYMRQKKLQELAMEELKTKMEIEQVKARVKIMGGEGQEFVERWQIRKI